MTKEKKEEKTQIKKREKGGKWDVQGSFTVEAAYVLPLIVFLIWNILYLSFFLYDESVALQGSYCTALRTERLIGTAEEKTRAAEKKYAESVEKKVVCGSVEGERDVTEKSVTVSTRLSMYAPAGRYFQSKWQGMHRQTAQVWRPVTFIRSCRKVEDIWSVLQTGN